MDQGFQCNLCAGRKFHYRDQLTERLGCDRQKYNIVKCKKCGLHSLFPIPNDLELEYIYENYTKKGNRIAVEEFRMKNIYPKKVNLIRKYIPQTGDILDIGAGIGGFAITAKRGGFHVTGIEPQIEQCTVAKELFGLDLLCSKFEQFQHDNTTCYDAVHLHHVLEHLQDPKSALLAIRERIKENGILILEVPNQFFVLKTELFAKFGKRHFDKSNNPYHHIHFFSPYTLRRMVGESGFKVLELNNISNDTENRRFKKTINHIISSIFRMGTSSRIEVVAMRSKIL
jgi:2-polyprenyl-3-methyl-5-hydroxy-6-metoxy-1,4-benzoquinol methylase